jgi:hypothetical protein
MHERRQLAVSLQGSLQKVTGHGDAFCTFPKTKAKTRRRQNILRRMQLVHQDTPSSAERTRPSEGVGLDWWEGVVSNLRAAASDPSDKIGRE